MSKFRFDKPVVYLGYGILSISVITFTLALLVFGLNVYGLFTMHKISSKSAPTVLLQNRLVALEKANLEVPKDVLRNCAKSGELNIDDANKVTTLAAEKIREILAKCHKASKPPAWYNEDLAIMNMIFWGCFFVGLLLFATVGWFVGRHLTQKAAK